MDVEINVYRHTTKTYDTVRVQVTPHGVIFPPLDHSVQIDGKSLSYLAALADLEEEFSRS